MRRLTKPLNQIEQNMAQQNCYESDTDSELAVALAIKLETSFAVL